MEKQFIDWYKNINQNRVGDSFSPHKPLAIVFALTKLLKGNRYIDYNSDREELEYLIWDYTNKPSRPNCLQPLFRLTNDSNKYNFWEFLPKDLPLTNSRDVVTSEAIKNNAKAGFSEELYQFFVKHPGLVQHFINRIIEDNFKETLIDDILTQLDLSEIRTFEPEIETEELQIIRYKRDPDFRKKILSIYNNQCVYCGLRLQLNHRYVPMEAAHIMAKSNGGPCIEQNGIALCPTHHYTFDRGIWTLGTDHIIKLSPKVVFEDKSKIFFKNYEGNSIKESITNIDLLPAQNFLTWHEKNIFKNR